MTREEIEQHKSCIDGMSQLEMCKLHRFAPVGHPYFDNRNIEVRMHWEIRWKERGGFTPEISKALG